MATLWVVDLPVPLTREPKSVVLPIRLLVLRLTEPLTKAVLQLVILPPLATQQLTQPLSQMLPKKPMSMIVRMTEVA